MYFLLGVSLKLAFLLIVNMAAALLASGIWSVAQGPIRTLSARTQASIIFFLRVAPVAAALIFVFAFVVPAYILYEPEDSGEVVSFKLAIIAGLSTIAVVVASYRVLRTWIATNDLARSWMAGSERIEINGVNVPVFKMTHPFPVIAVVGIFRPRLFVAEQVLQALNGDELAAAMAHEYGHMRSQDNLKRSILRVCRDLLILPLGADLDRAWARNAETAADDFAVTSSPSKALDLASALLKLARLAPAQLPRNAFAASFLFDEQHIDVTDRVRRLLKFAEDGPTSRSSPRFFPSWMWTAALLGLLLIHFSDRRLLLPTHEAIEHFVWLIS